MNEASEVLKIHQTFVISQLSKISLEYFLSLKMKCNSI